MAEEKVQKMTEEQFIANMTEREQGFLKENLFAVHNNIRIGKIKRDYAEVLLDIVPNSLNFRGTVHGGAYFAMADLCSGIVSRTDGRVYVTQQANVQYIRAATEGTLKAYGSVVHRGRTGCLTEIRIVGDNGKLVFMGTFLFHCIS